MDNRYINLQHLQNFANCPPCQPCPSFAAPPPPPPTKKEQTRVPYERKIVEYVEEQVVERVPVQTMKTVKRGKKVMVPVQRIETYYIKIEKIRDHRVEYESQIRTQSVKVPVSSYQYLPVQTKRIHYPENALAELSKGLYDFSKDILIAPQPNPIVQKKKAVLPTNDIQISPKQDLALMLSQPLIIQNFKSGKAIQADSERKKVWQQRSQDRSCQRWQLQKSQFGYRVAHQESGKVLDFDSYEQGTEVYLNNVDYKRETQLFNVEVLDGQLGYIRCSRNMNMFLGIKDQSSGQHALLQVQKFVPKKKGQQFNFRTK